MPHVALYFKKRNNERPLIKGVDEDFVEKFVTGHPIVQEWTIEETSSGELKVLIPKTYVILKFFKIHKIYLEFTEKT